MIQIWLIVALAICALTVLTLGAVLTRAGQITPARAALLALIGSTLLWIGEAAWRLVVPTPSILRLRSRGECRSPR